MDVWFLIGASFLTSTLTATIGLGGGVLLISLMAGVLPAAAIVPVHGAVQLASNASRVLLGRSHIEWRIALPFVAGAVVGAVAGSRIVVRLSFEALPLYLGVFVLAVTWIPMPTRVHQFRGQYAVLGAVQTFLSLFVGATGPMTTPFLLHAGLPRDRLVVTLGLAMTAIHVLKLTVFALAGFAFAPYAVLIGGMVGAVVLGSWVGTGLRGHVPERALRKVITALISALAVRMIVGSLV